MGIPGVGLFGNDLWPAPKPWWFTGGGACGTCTFLLCGFWNGSPGILFTAEPCLPAIWFWLGKNALPRWPGHIGGRWGSCIAQRFGLACQCDWPALAPQWLLVCWCCWYCCWPGTAGPGWTTPWARQARVTAISSSIHIRSHDEWWRWSLNIIARQNASVARGIITDDFSFEVKHKNSKISSEQNTKQEADIAVAYHRILNTLPAKLVW